MNDDESTAPPPSADDDGPRRVTLSKAHRSTPAGRELIELLTELSADGQVTREELARLRQWLEVDRGINFPACAFLYEVLDTISQDGEITEDELDDLALAIERVLPIDVRFLTSQKRRERQAIRRKDEAAKRAPERAARAAAQRAAQADARERARVLRRVTFKIAGTRRGVGRREACERLQVGEVVVLEREPDNIHDDNAILVFTGDTELGYVPRDDARSLAPLLDSGAEVDASIQKLHNTFDGYVLPIVIAKFRHGSSHPLPLQPVAEASADSGRIALPGSDQREPDRKPGSPRGCGVMLALCALLLALAVVAL